MMVDSGEHDHLNKVSYSRFVGDLNDMNVRIQRLDEKLTSSERIESARARICALDFGKNSERAQRIEERLSAIENSPPVSTDADLKALLSRMDGTELDVMRLRNTINAIGDRLDDETGGRLADQERRITALEQAKTDGEPFNRWSLAYAEKEYSIRFDGRHQATCLYVDGADRLVRLLNTNHVIP